jgi:SAM-dependent methyltransferase
VGADVEAAYAARAAEYTERIGSMSSVHPSDVALVTSWAASMDRPVLDAGCGPGHWTAYLAGLGKEVRGIDLVPAFIDHARTAHPTVSFSTGSLDALADPDDTYGGVLAWYSLIHHDPGDVRGALDEFARVLRPGGRLLVGFFLGDALEPFDHAVVRAWRWPADRLAGALDAAGFDVAEIHTRTAVTQRLRPHGAIVADLRSDGAS